MNNNFYIMHDLIDGMCTQEEYYSQFVTDELKRAILNRFNIRFLRSSSKDGFRNISTKYWDEILSKYLQVVDKNDIIEQWKVRRDFFSTGGMICAVKEAAKQIVLGE